MIPSPFDDIDAATLQALIGTAEESATLDFKRDLPGDDREARKEFVADVCALANTKGGDLVYGIDESDEGIAGRLVGHSFNPDDLIPRLTNVLADSLEPRLQGVRMAAIDAPEGGRILIIRVPKAFSGIHRGTRDGHFWVRDSRSKRQLDVPGVLNRMRELLGREDLLSSFFAGRYAAVLGETYPIRLGAGPKLVIHILPARDFLSGDEIDLAPMSRRGAVEVARHGPSVYAVPTHEGLVHLGGYTNGIAGGATLLFRSGVVEAVNALPLRQQDGGDQFVPLESVEDTTSSFLSAILDQATRHMTNGWPMTVRIAIVGAQGVRFLPRERMLRIHLDVDERPRVSVHSSVLSLPDIFLETPPENLLLQLRPVFDRLWQSWGLERSYSYEALPGGGLTYGGQPI